MASRRTEGGVSRAQEASVCVGTAVGRIWPITLNALWAMEPPVRRRDRRQGPQVVKRGRRVDPRSNRDRRRTFHRRRSCRRDPRASRRRRGVTRALVRFDSGPKFLAHAVADLAPVQRCLHLPHRTGSPCQNAWARVAQRAIDAFSEWGARIDEGRSGPGTASRLRRPSAGVSPSTWQDKASCEAASSPWRCRGTGPARCERSGATQCVLPRAHRGR